MAEFARAGSQRWLQVAVNRRPQLLADALIKSGAISSGGSVTWTSPLETDQFCEYRDSAALLRAGVKHLNSPLKAFWPNRGLVWDGIGVTSEGSPLFLEAKAHIPESVSPATRATPKSLELIEASLAKARGFYSPESSAGWSGLYYQYANRLAFHYFLGELNGVPSTLVFLYFVNAQDMKGPVAEEEWHGAVRLIHAALGLPDDLRRFGVFDAFVDVRQLRDAV